MTDKPAPVTKPVVVKPPFGIPVLWGRRGMGKTLASLNSPFQPVHVIDVENSSEDYDMHQDRLIELGFIKQHFTRVPTLTWESFMAEYDRITGRFTGPDRKTAYKHSDVRYGTIVLDTAGQIATWVATNVFGAASEAQAEKMGQVMWGKVRDTLRNMLLHLQSQCDLVVLTAHEREWKGVYTPRLNPSVLELTSLSLQLMRQPNQQIPDANVVYARLPFFPPRIPQFTLAKLMTYIQKPANWKELAEDEKIVEEKPVVTTPPSIEEQALDEG